MEGHSPDKLPHQANGWHGEHHHRDLDAVIGMLKLSTKKSAVDSMIYSKAQELLHDVSYYDNKMILATPRPSLQHHFGVTSVFAGDGCIFSGHDNLNLTDQGFQLNHHWEIPNGVSVKVEDLLLWESPSRFTALIGDFETSDERAVCHRRVVLLSLGDHPVELGELTCIFFRNDGGGITTYPTDGCPLVESRITEEIAEKLKRLTTQEKATDVREELVANREAALNTAADVLDGIKEGLSLRQENTDARESDLHSAKEVVIGREEEVIRRKEELTSRENRVTGREQVVTDREKDLNLREELVTIRESDLQTAERSLEERETDVLCLGEELAGRVLELQSAEYAIKYRLDDVLVQEKFLAERELGVQTAEFSVKARKDNAFVREEAVTQLGEAVRAAEDSVKARHEDTSAREESVTQREYRVQAAEDSIKARESDTNSREHWIEERLATIETIEIAIDHRHTALDCSEVDLDNREEAMAARELSVAERESEIEKGKKDVAKHLEAATSYDEINELIHKSLRSRENALAKDRAEFEAEMEKREAALAEREVALARLTLEADGYSIVDTPIDSAKSEDGEDWEVEGTELPI